MCDIHEPVQSGSATIVPVEKAVGMVLAHDITEVNTEVNTEVKGDEFKGAAFRKGHVIRQEDLTRLRVLGKESIYILRLADDEMHEDEAAGLMADALMGEGVEIQGVPREGKINIIASCDGILRVNREALTKFNMLGEVMCATQHDATMVKKGDIVAGTRAIPLVVRKDIVGRAVEIANGASGMVAVAGVCKPRAGVVITGSEVYYGRKKDSFAPVIREKLKAFGGEELGVFYAPDDREFIEGRLRELLDAGADLLVTTGGMSVDPDDVTRFAIRELGARDIVYGSPVLPGAMVLVAYIEHEGRQVPIIGVPACGMYAKTTVLDLVLPRILSGEKIQRKDLAALGHGGLCLQCEVCRYPVCPFGKG